MSKDRLEVFSDGVFAIIMTLLVLELRPPPVQEPAGWSQYAEAMAPLIPKFVSFILSFATVAVHWVGHHYFYRHITRGTIGLVWLNNLVLLWICIIPFPTALLGDHPTDQFPIVVYALNSLLCATSFLVMRAYAVHMNLLKTGTESLRSLGPWHSVPAVLLYMLSILLSFVSVYLALVCFFIVPLLYVVPTLLSSHDREVSAHL